MIYDDSKTRAKNRKKIVDVAKTLFIEKGIAHTTVMDIIKSAGMERKTFYNYFEGKEEISDYIYYQSISCFYSKGFGEENFLRFDNGYKKVEHYLNTLVNRFIECELEMLFVVHYDYYYNKQVSNEMLNAIYEDNDVFNHKQFFLEGASDGSMDFSDKNPIEISEVVCQSIGAYASRIISRGYKTGVAADVINFQSIYDLIQLHLKALKV